MIKSFKCKFKTKKKYKKLVLDIAKYYVICMLTLGAVMAYINISDNRTKAVAILTLNYENSSAGLNPDNSKFNLRLLKESEPLGEALEDTEMNMYLAPQELASYIKIKGVSSKPIDVNSDTKYIDSTYKVTLNWPKKYADIVPAKKMLSKICESYHDWFLNNYVVDSEALEIDTGRFGTMEYASISSYLDMMAVRGKNYLIKKDETSTAFTGLDGTTWKSLKQELDNLTNYDLATFNQYIWENGIAKDKTWEIVVMNHTNDELTSEYELYLANVEKYSIVVDQYRNEMTSSVLIPTYDESGQFYMSRTKTGIDEISKDMDRYLGDATAIKEKIDINNNKIEKLKNSGEVSTEKADIMLEDIQTKIVDIFERIKKLDKEYQNKKTKGYVQYEIID